RVARDLPDQGRQCPGGRTPQAPAAPPDMVPTRDAVTNQGDAPGPDTSAALLRVVRSWSWSLRAIGKRVSQAACGFPATQLKAGLMMMNPPVNWPYLKTHIGVAGLPHRFRARRSRLAVGNGAQAAGRVVRPGR